MTYEPTDTRAKGKELCERLWVGAIGNWEKGTGLRAKGLGRIMPLHNYVLRNSPMVHDPCLTTHVLRPTQLRTLPPTTTTSYALRNPAPYSLISTYLPRDSYNAKRPSPIGGAWKCVLSFASGERGPANPNVLWMFYSAGGGLRCPNRDVQHTGKGCCRP